MISILRLLVFLMFVILGARVATAADDRRRARINQLLLFILGANLCVGLSQYDLWPFPTYVLVPNVYREDATYTRMEFAAVLADGSETEIDPYVWSPVFPLVLNLWFRVDYPHLDEPARRQAMTFLLAKARAGMDRLARGERVGSQRLLGAFAAPDWWMYARPRRQVRATTIRGLRVYFVEWHPIERWRDRRAVARRTLVAETRE